MDEKKAGCGFLVFLSLAIPAIALLFGENILGRLWERNIAQAEPANVDPPQVPLNNGAVRHSTINKLDFDPSKESRNGLIETQLRTKRLVRVIECRTGCKGSPSTHTTLGLNIQNDSDRTIVLDNMRFNVGEMRVMNQPVTRPTQCKNDWVGYKNPSVKLNFDTLKIGDSVEVEAALEVPPGESRSFGMCFLYESSNEDVLPYMLLRGTLIMPYGDSEITQVLEICGPSEDAAARNGAGG